MTKNTELPPLNAPRKLKRTAYMRRWRRRQTDRCTSVYLEYHRDLDVAAMIHGGFMAEADRCDKDAIRAALQDLVNQALDLAAEGRFTFYRSPALGSW